jgi:hypothetical protein
VVVASVGNDLVGPLAWTADPICDGPDAVNEREQLSDVVAVPASQRDHQRYPSGVHQQVVLGAGASAVNRRRPGQATLEERGCGLSLRPPRPVDPAYGVQAAEKFAVDLGSTEERVLISVNKYKARLASLRQILDKEFS